MENSRAMWPGWETTRLIGRGNFGEVYEIQRELFGEIEKAAVKVISIPQNSGDIEELYADGYDNESIINILQSHLESIVLEYVLMRKMNGCSNIVNCDDIRYIQHDDGMGWDVFIKMELLTPLPKSLPDTITDDFVINIAYDICTALDLCSKYDIVHRDIKTQNIFVSPNGDYKLGDFGIAKTIEKTTSGTKIGTYKYMAPEVYNYQPYSSSADIYSLGLVLYWLLNNRRLPFLPLPPENPTALAEEDAKNRRLSGEQIPMPAHGGQELKRIILKACAHDPKKRYQTAKEMKDDLSILLFSSLASQPECEESLHSEAEHKSQKQDSRASDSHAKDISHSQGTNSTSDSVADSVSVEQRKTDTGLRRLDYQKALDRMHKEMDIYERTLGNKHRSGVDTQQYYQEWEKRRRVAAEKETKHKKKEQDFLSMISLFRD